MTGIAEINQKKIELRTLFYVKSEKDPGFPDKGFCVWAYSLQFSVRYFSRNWTGTTSWRGIRMNKKREGTEQKEMKKRFLTFLPEHLVPQIRRWTGNVIQWVSYEKTICNQVKTGGKHENFFTRNLANDCWQQSSECTRSNSHPFDRLADRSCCFP